MTQFISEDLVSREYVDRLQADLRDCLMCRFLVAYISDAGINAIGRRLLVDALGKAGSFGVGSLSCSCGFEPLLGLQESIGGGRAKLKYFMDPIVRNRNEPSLALLHSKLVYLAIPSQNKSVVYSGSHNWTGPALSGTGKVNAEASFRIEFPYKQEHALGRGNSIPAQVNRHLLEAKDLAACRDATEANRATFEQWYDKGCRTNPTPKTDDTFIILAVLKNASRASQRMFSDLADKGIYLRTDNSGKAMYLAEHRRLIVMLWCSESDLEAGNQPILIRCRRSSDVPDVSADVKSTNTAPSPIEGFGAAIYGRKAVTLWSGREARAFEFDFQTGSSSSQAFDSAIGGRSPEYRFHLEVLNVVFPAVDKPDFPLLAEHGEYTWDEYPVERDFDRKEFPDWQPDSFAVAAAKKKFKFIGIDGYLVGPEDEEGIASCFKQFFGIDKGDAKVWPTSECDEEALGNFVTDHPLHETYLRSAEKQTIAEKVKKGAKAIIPLLPKEAFKADQGIEQSLQAINRVEQGFVRQLDELFAQWERSDSR